MLVTVSREMGSGGSYIGSRVAEILGYGFVDREILHHAAESIGASEESLEVVDERRPSLAERIATWISAGFEDVSGLREPLVLPREGYPALLPTEGDYLHLMQSVIRELAGRGNMVIVGRGAQLVLRDREDALHVHITAPFELRVQRISVREGISLEAATKRVRESDKNRSGYVRTFYQADWRSPGLYALIINTGKMELEEAVALVVEAARALERRLRASPI